MKFLVAAEQVENFWFLLKNLPHWEFEGFLMFLDNVVVGLALLPLGRRWLKKHDAKKHAHECCEPTTLTVPIEVIKGIRYVKADDLGISEVDPA